MPQLALFFLRRDRQALGAAEAHYERIKALLAIGPAGQVKQDCIVDTGAPLSLFPQREWERFENEITWLYKPGDRGDLPDWLAKVTGLGAQSVACRIGKIRIQILEMRLTLPPTSSPPVEIIAKFPEDNGAYKQILLGLGGGAFEKWRFILDYPNSRAWFEY